MAVTFITLKGLGEIILSEMVIMVLSLAASPWNWWYRLCTSEVTSMLAEPDMKAHEIMNLSHEGWGVITVLQENEGRVS